MLARFGTGGGLLGILAATYLASLVLPFLAVYPQSLMLSTGPFWDDLVRFINIHLYDYLDAVKTALLIYVLIPLKRLLLEAPWPGVALLVGYAGWRLGGLQACRAGRRPGGVHRRDRELAEGHGLGLSVRHLGRHRVSHRHSGRHSRASSERMHRIIQNIIDTLQTLPSFVYLIPVVMLFQVGEFSAMIAIVLYALAPAIRYADHGIRRVPPEIIEASVMAGCRRGQILRKVKLPLALPEIMLGVNQTIMMALSMLVITALVGTSDLGQEVYIALTRADIGHGIVAGVCVAFIAIIADRLIGAWAHPQAPARILDGGGMTQRPPDPAARVAACPSGRGL
jgi:glycine betaine/proline transport system permease protein